MGLIDHLDEQTERGVYSILDDLHSQLLAAKAASVRGIGKTLLLREDKGQLMTLEEFSQTITETLGLSLSDKELAKVFASYRGETGTMDFNRFLAGVRGELSPARRQLVDQVYWLLDPEGTGNITADAIRAQYNTTCNQGLSMGVGSASFFPFPSMRMHYSLAIVHPGPCLLINTWSTNETGVGTFFPDLERDVETSTLSIGLIVIVLLLAIPLRRYGRPMHAG